MAKFFTAQQPGSLRVDRVNRRINGVAIAQKGMANGDAFDDETLRLLVQLGNSGNVRARFDHPNRADPGEIEQTLNNLLGQHENFRIDGEFCRADSQFTGVNAELEDKVMDFADKTPHLFGLSVVIDDSPPPGKKAKKGDPCRPTALYAADYVDIPASNRAGLFAAKTAESEKAMEPTDLFAKNGLLFCTYKGEEIPLKHTPESLDASHEMWKAGRKKEGEDDDDTDMEAKAKKMGFRLVKVGDPATASADEIEKARKDGVEAERTYRKAFSTVVTSAAMDADTAKAFEETFYGQDEKTLKFHANRTVGTRAKPVGEGSGTPEGAQRDPGSAEGKLAAIEDEAGKRFDAELSVRRMYACTTSDAASDQWKTAKGRHVAAARRRYLSETK